MRHVEICCSSTAIYFAKALAAVFGGLGKAAWMDASTFGSGVNFNMSLFRAWSTLIVYIYYLGV